MIFFPVIFNVTFILLESADWHFQTEKPADLFAVSQANLQ
jgi:hypothetical protein